MYLEDVAKYEADGKEIRKLFRKTQKWLNKVYPQWFVKQMTREQIAWAIACYVVTERETGEQR